MNVFKMTWQADDRKVVACTSSLCGSLYTSRDEFKTSISAINDNNNFITSTMTITNVSRLSPFNMETQWTCAICADWEVLECNKLQIYGRDRLSSFEIEKSYVKIIMFNADQIYLYKYFLSFIQHELLCLNCILYYL